MNLLCFQRFSLGGGSMPHLGGGRLAGRRRGGAEARATEDGHEFLHRQSRQELKESKRKKDLKKKKTSNLH